MDVLVSVYRGNFLCQIGSVFLLSAPLCGGLNWPTQHFILK